MPAPKRKKLTVLLSIVVGLLTFSGLYVWTHPLVFNESFFQHAHCIRMGGTSLMTYAEEHQGKFPYHTNGYGDALLLVTDAWLPSLTGPGYSAAPLERALKTGQPLSESECGRVYVQGLSMSSASEIALLFDKRATPGGDHCHLFSRMTASLAREVWTVGSGQMVIKESAWPAYARRQIELLVSAGIPRPQAEAYYAQTTKL